MIEHSKISTRWRDGSAPPKARSHSILSCLDFLESIWLQWKSRAEIPSWRWARMAILSLSALPLPAELYNFWGSKGETTHFFVTDEKGNYFNWTQRRRKLFSPCGNNKKFSAIFSLILQHQPSNAGAPWVHKQATFGITQDPWISSRFLLPQRDRSQAQLQGWWLRKLFPKRESMFYTFLAIA